MIKRSRASAILMILRSPGFIVLVVCLFLLMIQIAVIGRVRPFNSDDVFWQTALRTWKPFNGDMMHLATKDTFVAEIPFFAVLNHFFDNSRRLLITEAFLLTASSFTIFYGSSLYFLKKLGVKLNYWVLLPFIWLASFGYPIIQNYLNTVWRTYDIGFCFLTFALVAAITFGDIKPLKTNLSRTLTILFCLLSGILIYSDPYRLFFCFAPILLFCLVLWYIKRINVKDLGIIVGGGFLSIVFAKATEALCLASGMLVITETPSAFVDFEKIGSNLITSIHDMLIIYGADFFGRPTSDKNNLGLVINAVILGIIIYQVLRLHPFINIKVLSKTSLEKLWSIFFGGLIAFVFVLFTISTLVNTANYRYYILSVFASIVFLAYLIGTMKTKRARQVISGLLIVATALNLYFTVSGNSLNAQKEVVDNRGNSLNFDIIHAVEAEGLHKGYAGYWHGNINTYLSNEEVTFLPTYCRDEKKGTTENFTWLIDDKHYDRSAARTFYVVDSDMAPPKVCNEDQLIKQFGIPQKKLSVRGKSILIFNYDIGDKITK